MSIVRATSVPFRDEKAVSCSVGGGGDRTGRLGGKYEEPLECWH